jgi:hypothetical protein
MQIISTFQQVISVVAIKKEGKKKHFYHKHRQEDLNLYSWGTENGMDCETFPLAEHVKDFVGAENNSDQTAQVEQVRAH